MDLKGQPQYFSVEWLPFFVDKLSTQKWLIMNNINSLKKK
jgi:hypothetical protein